MKLANFFYLLAPMLAAGCSSQEGKINSNFVFNWGTNLQFQVVEKIQKKSNLIEVVHHCEWMRTNDEFILLWNNPEITRFNGTKTSASMELKKALAPVEKGFWYPAFRIDEDGGFVETIDPETALAKADQMLDQVVTNRTENSRKFFANWSKSELGKKTLNQIYGSIWQTWVETWTDLDIKTGEVQSTNAMMFFSGVEMPVKVTLRNLGASKSDASLVRLEYEQDLYSTNFSPAVYSLIETAQSETGINGGGPITNECSMHRLTTLEVETERQTLKPHWAKRTVKTEVSSPGETTKAELEVHEYHFLW